MTVRELIEKLAECPQNSEVRTTSKNGGNHIIEIQVESKYKTNLELCDHDKCEEPI